jgi:hypothetical protein
MKRLVAPALCALMLLAVPAVAAAMPAPESPGPVHAAPTTTVHMQHTGGSLAVILASAALAVALGGASYVVLRVRPAIRAS